MLSTPEPQLKLAVCGASFGHSRLIQAPVKTTVCERDLVARNHFGALWGMLYADDAGVVSRSPEQLRKTMGVIVVVRAAFGHTVSEAKPEIMCLRAKGMPESTATFSVEAAG